MVKIFTAGLAIDSMKASGYKDAAHAIAELIDNSLQAGELVERKKTVEIICIEKSNFFSNREVKQIDKIALYDNACGMDKETMSLALAFGQGTRRKAKSGMGKFGLGLPNASISQCDRVDIYSWQKNKILHSYLDLEEIIQDKYDEVPEPKPISKLPREWEKKISSNLEDSGTLIVWSDLKRLKWRRHAAFFNNSEFLVGRMYRHFLKENSCEITMSAFDEKGKIIESRSVKPNDPLYLMTNTSTPKVSIGEDTYDFSKEPAYIEIGEKKEPINWRGEKHYVTIRASEVRADFRKFAATSGTNPGNTALGKHAAKNQGISIVRAGRELELSNAFVNTYDPVERFWGIEVSFEPALDEVFGVTNNKQSATSFSALSLSKLAEEEDLSPSELEAELTANEDPRLAILKISEAIFNFLKLIRKNLAQQTKGIKTAAQNGKENQDAASAAATKATEKDESQGLSDKISDEISDADKKKALEDEIDRDGLVLDEEQKEIVLSSWLESKYIFQSADFRGSDYIFDVSQPGGNIKITFNSAHLVYQNFIQPIEDESGEAYDLLRLLFAAWARTEDRLSLDDDNKQSELAELRKFWGQTAANMLAEYEK